MKDADRKEIASEGRAAVEVADKGGRPEPSLWDVSSVLRVRRWEAQEGPFRGFGSPPGKF